MTPKQARAIYEKADDFEILPDNSNQLARLVLALSFSYPEYKHQLDKLQRQRPRDNVDAELIQQISEAVESRQRAAQITGKGHIAYAKENLVFPSGRGFKSRQMDSLTVYSLEMKFRMEEHGLIAHRVEISFIYGVLTAAKNNKYYFVPPASATLKVVSFDRSEVNIKTSLKPK